MDAVLSVRTTAKARPLFSYAVVTFVLLSSSPVRGHADKTPRADLGDVSPLDTSILSASTAALASEPTHGRGAFERRRLQPTLTSSNAAQCVVSTGGTCACSSNYSPASCEDGSGDGVGMYSMAEACSFTLSAVAMLSVEFFVTQASTDKLIVNGVPYSGGSKSDGPVLGADPSCKAAKCGVGAKSIKLPLPAASTKLPPAVLLTPKCASGVAGCVRLPRPTPPTLGLEPDRSGPSFTAATGAGAPVVESSYVTAAVAFGDVNGDGKIDIFVGNNAAVVNELWLNAGDGTFTAKTGATSPVTAASTQAVALADFNGDGALDLFVANDQSAHEMWLNTNDGTGSFNSKAGGPAAGFGTAIAVGVADVNGDGAIDLFIGHNSNMEPNQLWLNTNDGSGSFTAHSDSNGPAHSAYSTRAVAFGDVNGDGAVDLFVANEYSACELWLNVNDGSGSFTAKTGGPATATSAVATSAAFADVNGDGAIDLFIGRYSVATHPSELWINMNDGSGSFIPAVGAFSTSVKMDTHFVAFADANGDGAIDIFMGNEMNSNVLFLNDGSGSFSAATGGPAGGAIAVGGAAFGDLDGDGAADLFIGGRTAKNELWLSGKAGSFTITTGGPNGGSSYTGFVGFADFNGDAAIDLFVCNEGAADYSTNEIWFNDGSGVFAAAPSAGVPSGKDCGVAFADVDNDGDIDIFDGAFWKNDGSGAFKIALGMTSGATMSGKSTAVAFADFNGDGFADLFIGSQMQLWLNDRSGLFTLDTMRVPLVTSDVEAVAFGDIDGDGDLDLFVGSGSTLQANVLLTNDGSGTFQSASFPTVQARQTKAVGFADVDGDGDLDLLVGNSGSNNELWINDGAGAFTAKTGALTSGTASTYALALGDFDADGDVDLFFGSYGGTGNELWVNDGSGDYTALQAGPTVAVNPTSAAAFADVNGDGTLDLLVGKRWVEGGECIECLIGEYADANRTVACKACPSFATTSAIGSTSIDACECVKGYYEGTNAAGTKICPACPEGSTTNSSGATSVNQCVCQAGRYFNTDAGGAVTCPLCPEGSSTDAAGATSVDQCVCRAGRFLSIDADGAATCPQCKDVVANSASLVDGATSPDACECIQGFYLNVTAKGTRTCVACDPSLMDCSIPGVTLANMPIKKGGWRLGNDTSKVYECFNPLACVGAAGPSANVTASRRRQLSAASRADVSTAGDALCAAGHMGFLCGTCQDGWYGYSDATLCTACTDNSVISFAPAIAFAIATLIVIAIFCKSGAARFDVNVIEAAATGGLAEAAQAKAAEKLEAKLGERSAAGRSATRRGVSLLSRGASWLQKISPKVKILISLYQILQGIGAVFAIPFPPFYESAIAAIGALIQVEIPSLVPLDCIVRTSYYSKLVFKCAWPLAAYILLGTLAKLFSKTHRQGAADACINLAFLIMFIVYPALSSGLFSMFYCVPLEDGTSWLRVDLSLECSTPLHATMTLFTYVMLGVHVVGTPLTYLYLFFWKHHHALEALKEQELADADKGRIERAKAYTQQQAVANAEGAPNKPRIEAEAVLPGYMLRLTGGYEYRTYWFELFETLRKVLLVGIPSTFPERGETAQLFWGLLVCFATFGAYMMFSPFVEASDDMLSQLAQLQIFLTLLSSLALRATPPSKLAGDMVTIILFTVPCIGVLLETPLLEYIGAVLATLTRALGRLCMCCKRPRLAQMGDEDRDQPIEAPSKTTAGEDGALTPSAFDVSALPSTPAAAAVVASQASAVPKTAVDAVEECIQAHGKEQLLEALKHLGVTAATPRVPAVQEPAPEPNNWLKAVSAAVGDTGPRKDLSDRIRDQIGSLFAVPAQAAATSTDAKQAEKKTDADLSA